MDARPTRARLLRYGLFVLCFNVRFPSLFGFFFFFFFSCFFFFFFFFSVFLFFLSFLFRFSLLSFSSFLFFPLLPFCSHSFLSRSSTRARQASTAAASWRWLA